jgi:hypothetical protein
MCIADRNERRLVHELAETMAVRRWPDHPSMWDFIRDAEPLVRRFHEQEAMIPNSISGELSRPLSALFRVRSTPSNCSL